MLNHEQIQKWRRDNGDNTHNLNYDLDENSIVMELGGYTGEWAQKIIKKYNPNLFIVEPIEKFYSHMVSKFANNSKVNLLNVGVGVETKKDQIFINGDGSSRNIKIGEPIEIQIETIENIFDKFNLSKVDLVQINIEGDEYPLLENMLDTGFIENFKNVQIQFHLNIEDCIERRQGIQQKLLEKKYNKKFDYPFVWESWEKMR